MKKRTKLADRKLPFYTKGEEIFNMVSHIVGAAFGVVMLVLCTIFAAVHGSLAGVLSSVTFGVCMIVLYTMSAIYHGLSPRLKTAKKVMQIFDHLSIFLLIAGSYTPITLCGVMRANVPLAWTIFGVVWGMSILGIVLNAIDIKKYSVFSMVCYIALGWCIILSLPDLMMTFPPVAIILLFMGGICYTVGAILYGVGRKVRYMHSIFHLLVVAGSILHGLMILLFVL